jgi:hypothetical protein
MLLLLLTIGHCMLSSMASAKAHEPPEAATAARLGPQQSSSSLNCSAQLPPPVVLFSPRSLAKAALPLLITFQPGNKSQGQEPSAWQR